MQYRSDVTQTINYFAERKYHLFIHWLNPGFNDDAKSEDYLNLIPYFHQLGYILNIKHGKAKPVSLTLEEYLTYSDRTINRYELLCVGFLVVRSDTNLNNERITNNHSYI